MYVITHNVRKQMTPNEMTPSQEELNTNEPVKEETKKEETATEAQEQQTPDTPAEPQPEKDGEKTYAAPETKEAVIARMSELSHADGIADKDEIELLKKRYYRLRFEEVAAQREAFLNAGGNEEDFEPNADADEERFKAELKLIKEKRAQEHERLEKIKQDNLKRKLEILEKIKELSSSLGETGKNYDAFRKLQAEWKEANPVPQENATELWKNYEYCVENFYDMLKLNNEFREYDFRKNLEAKTRLCEAAEKLETFGDPVSAFHQLQKLHQEFREIGPVAKDLREQVWERFKAASTIVNKRHQEHFDKLKETEKENLVKKTALCEKAEAVSTDNLKTYAEWDKATNIIKEIQAEWKTIGFTPKSVNTKIFERFRSVCDSFFAKKNEHFKQQKAIQNENYGKKLALCEKAEALKDSTEWGATANAIRGLRAKWKEIGPVPNKYNESLWKRFSEACNAFFDARSQASASQRQSENENLETKRSIIEQLKAITADAKDEGVKKVQELMAQWQATGHIPYKLKEKFYVEYHEQIDRIYNELNIRRMSRRVENIKAQATAAISRGGDAMFRERERLFRMYEAKRNEMQTYENNLGFLNVSSKSGNGFVNEIRRKIENLKNEVANLRKSIEDIDEKAKAGTQDESTPADGNAENKE